MKISKISAIRPRWGSLQRSPDPLAVFKGPTSKGMEGEGEGRGEGKKSVSPNGSLDAAVEEGGKGRRARRGAYVGVSRHFFFPTLSTAISSKLLPEVDFWLHC